MLTILDLSKKVRHSTVMKRYSPLDIPDNARHFLAKIDLLIHTAHDGQTSEPQ